jgi:hypothetical protein
MSEEVKKKCPNNQEFCLGEEKAKQLMHIGDLGHKMETAGVKALEKFAYNPIKSALTNPVKCAAGVLTGFPATIGSIFTAITNGISSVGNAFENTAEKVIENPFAPFQMFFANTSGRLSEFFAGILGVKGLMKDGAESKEILQAMLNMSSAFGKIFDDPEFQTTFNAWLQNHATSLDKAVNIAIPKFRGVTDKLTGVVTETTKKFGDALGSTLTNVISAILKSIPVVGAVFNIAALAKQIGTKIISICEPLISKGGLSILSMANMAAKGIAKTKCAVSELTEKVEPILKNIQGTHKAGPIQTGGRDVIRKRKHAAKATQRVERLLKQFTRRQTKEPNYAKQLSKLRKY